MVKVENNAETKYVYGLGLIGEEVSGNFKTYHFDYRGSTVAITNASGTVTDTFEYDTYGNLTARTGTTKTPFLYNGRDGVMYEDDTGLYYMRARYYSPVLRRFVNADRVHGDISNSLTLNRYSFCNGNPADNVDPMGLSAERGRVGNTVNKTNYLPSTMLYIKPIPIDVIDALKNKQIENQSEICSDTLKSINSSSSYESMVIARSTTAEAGFILGLSSSKTWVTDGKDFVYEESLTLKQGFYAGIEVCDSIIIYYGYSSLKEYKDASKKYSPKP